jgi:cytochrome c
LIARRKYTTASCEKSSKKNQKGDPMLREMTTMAAALAAALIQTGAYGQVDAKKAEALAKQSTCLNCHAVDTKKVGPSFKDVAAKNKGADADKLVAALKAKPVHQAALKATKEEDMKTILTWVLSQS